MTLEEDLTAKEKGSRKVAKRLGFFANVMYALILLSSSTATILAALSLPDELVAVVAALPGVITVWLSTFKPDAKSQWWWSKWSKLDEVLGALRYQRKNEADVQEEWNSFIRNHENKYPGSGRPPIGEIA
jgi:hypothetical protein